jgi:hypothetical protein
MKIEEILKTNDFQFECVPEYDSTGKLIGYSLALNGKKINDIKDIDVSDKEIRKILGFNKLE